MKSRYLQDFELRELKKNTKSNLWLPQAVALATGLRIGDVVAIRLNDIDDKKGGIHYVAQKTRKCGFAKLGKALRDKLRQNADPLSGFCFPSKRSNSGHLTRQAVWKRVKTAAEKAALDCDGVSPHGLRKNYAVELYKREGLKAVQTALQHDRADTTQIYAMADFTTGENAALPLLRSDVELIVKLVTQQVISSLKAQKKRGVAPLSSEGS